MSGTGGMSIPDRIAADMRALPEATRKAVRPRIRAAGGLVVNQAKINAAWSTRIPSTVRMRTSFRAGREGVTIIAGDKSTPHARPFEGFSGYAQFRHPVFADRARKTSKGWTWVTQTTRPFLFPAAEQTESETTAMVFAALDDAGKEIGF